MSRLFEALSGLKAEQRAGVIGNPVAAPAVVPPLTKREPKPENHTLKVVQETMGPLSMAQALRAQEVEVKEIEEEIPRTTESEETPAVFIYPSPESHLVALTEPNSLGAEKFRALVTRFDHLRGQGELRSFQVTSSVINEGKTLVSANVAVTLAKYSGSNTLLVEGDLHRPALAGSFGITGLRGLNHWWSGADPELDKFVHQFSGMPLWLLPAGKPCDQPSDLLRSARFVKAFTQLASQFEWIVVDSTPMLPIVDVNLWSRLVDGTLLVVREGVAPIKAVKRGLQALDHPKLIGVVINEATEFDQVNYEGQYYGDSEDSDKSAKKRYRKS